MHSQSGIVSNDLHITKPTQLTGVAGGRIVVRAGGQLVIHGRINQDITVETSGQAAIYGTICSSIYNRGGEVHVHRDGNAGGVRSKATFLQRALRQLLMKKDMVELSGIVQGDLIVESGGVLSVRGVLEQPIIIQASGVAELYGVVESTITNTGQLRIYGPVEGALYREAGVVVAAPDAQIRGGVISQPS